MNKNTLAHTTPETITPFFFVNHWNSRFDGMIYMNSVSNYPLQSYLQTVVVNPEAFFRNTNSRSADLAIYLELVNAKTNNATQLFFGCCPHFVHLSVFAKIFYDRSCHGQREGLN